MEHFCAMDENITYLINNTRPKTFAKHYLLMSAKYGESYDN